MKPSNYSFIDKFIAGSAQPYSQAEIAYYIADGVTDILSLTPQKPLVSKYLDSRVKHHHIPVYSKPDNDQVNQFLEIIEKTQSTSGKLVVHCQYGQERTGIFLAIYLVEIQDFSVKKAIKKIQELRPSSLRSNTSVNYLIERYKK